MNKGCPEIQKTGVQKLFLNTYWTGCPEIPPIYPVGVYIGRGFSGHVPYPPNPLNFWTLSFWTLAANFGLRFLVKFFLRFCPDRNISLSSKSRLSEFTSTTPNRLRAGGIIFSVTQHRQSLERWRTQTRSSSPNRLGSVKSTKAGHQSACPNFPAIERMAGPNAWLRRAHRQNAGTTPSRTR
jgi:hypothetical protein